MKIAAANYPITFHKTFEEWKGHVASWVEKAVEADLLYFRSTVPWNW
jgi:hypothetical protein